MDFSVSDTRLHAVKGARLLNIFICLLLAVLGLHCCMKACSRCSEWGLPPSCSGFSCPAARALGRTGCRSCGMWAPELWHTGFVAPQHAGSSQTRDRTSVPCTGRWILHHWTTREVQSMSVYNLRGILHGCYRKWGTFQYSCLENSMDRGA